MDGNLFFVIQTERLGLSHNAGKENSNIICSNTNNKDNAGHLKVVFDARRL